MAPPTAPSPRRPPLPGTTRLEGPPPWGRPRGRPEDSRDRSRSAGRPSYSTGPGRTLAAGGSGPGRGRRRAAPQRGRGRRGTTAPNTNRNAAKRFGHCIMGSSVNQPYRSGSASRCRGRPMISVRPTRGLWDLGLIARSFGQRVHEIHRPDELAGGRHRSEPLLEDRRDVARAIQASRALD